jgi:hypothetical protein
MYAEVGRNGSTFTSFSAIKDGKDFFALNSYLRTGGSRLSAHRVHTGLRDIGLAAGRFHEKYRRRSTTGGCKGYESVRHGTLTGRFRFRGEGGYLTANAHRVDARVTVDRTRNCGGAYRTATPEGGGSVLTACGAENSLLAVFAPDEDVFPDSANVQAAMFEDTARTSIIREVHTTGQLELNRDLTAASFEAGAPFRGTGTYSDRRLSGDLSVRFLGVDHRVALTPGKARLRRTDGSYSINCEHVGVAGGISLAGPARASDGRPPRGFPRPRALTGSLHRTVR